ncbi:5-methylcytosine-specific restriction protein A [Paraburkholderia sp. UCT70]|uniref:HNH endonuclease n=1 Tax=Paraburkholderia sp. UCT70 TaxID=2991068 RepID=UPI003D1E79EE
MSEGLDIEALRRKLESRFQVTILSQLETVDGGDFNTLRPAELEQGNGFAILLSRTHRQFEASFKADNFAGALLRVMSEANNGQREAFFRAKESATTSGIQVYVAINGNDGENCIELADRWARVEIDISRRFPSGKTADDIQITAFQVASACFTLVLALSGTGEEGQDVPDSSTKGLPEGAKLRVEVNRYERSPVNRAACIEHYGPRCQCCGFEFFDIYGELGDGYVEVHHRVPVSKLGPAYIVDPVKDLIPLCGNCHSMVHRTDPPMVVEDLGSLVKARRTAKLLDR